MCSQQLTLTIKSCRRICLSLFLCLSDPLQTGRRKITKRDETKLFKGVRMRLEHDNDKAEEVGDLTH